MGKIVILSGPSGVGKDTVIDAWRAANPKVERVVAYTTRTPRSGEINGVDYNFVPVETCLEMAENGAFLEHKRVFDNYYATPAAEPDRIASEGGVAILKIDVQGALAVMPLRPEALTVFLLPPSDEVLRQRIEGRRTDPPEVIAKRLLEAQNEIAQASYYQHKIVNETVDEVVARLRELTEG